MNFWKKTLMTMLASAITGGLSLLIVLKIGGLFINLLIYPHHQSPGDGAVLLCALIIGGFCAVKAGNWAGRFLDRND